jgi:glycosyltransferase involved in cell wall biosynthesis
MDVNTRSPSPATKSAPEPNRHEDRRRVSGAIAVFRDHAQALYAGPHDRAHAPVLSIVMAVYNEERALPEVLDEALEVVAAAPLPSEIVLVDDASTDRSLEILRDYERRHAGVLRVLRHEANRGIMGAFETLYHAARGRFVFLNASDGQWKTAECLRFLEVCDRYDIIVGRRRVKHYTLWRRLVSGSFNLLPRILFGVPTYDAGSIKLFRADVLRIPLMSRSPFREAERIIRANRLGYRVGAVDVEHHDRRRGRATGARLRLVVLSVADLWRCWWDIVLLRHK